MIGRLSGQLERLMIDTIGSGYPSHMNPGLPERSNPWRKNSAPVAELAPAGAARRRLFSLPKQFPHSALKSRIRLHRFDCRVTRRTQPGAFTRPSAP